jgi:hypothetical protein
MYDIILFLTSDLRVIHKPVAILPKTITNDTYCLHQQLHCNDVMQDKVAMSLQFEFSSNKNIN